MKNLNEISDLISYYGKVEKTEEVRQIVENAMIEYGRKNGESPEFRQLRYKYFMETLR